MNRRYVVVSIICLAAVTKPDVENYNNKSIQAMTNTNNIYKACRAVY